MDWIEWPGRPDSACWPYLPTPALDYQTEMMKKRYTLQLWGKHSKLGLYNYFHLEIPPFCMNN